MNSLKNPRVYRVFYFVPLLFALGFLSLLIRVYHQLGHLPQTPFPDPQSLPMDIHVTLVYAGLIHLPWCALAAFFLIWSERFAWIAYLSFLTGFLALVFLELNDFFWPTYTKLPFLALSSIGLALFCSWYQNRSITRLQVLYLVSLTTVVLWINVDPYGLFEWFYD